MILIGLTGGIGCGKSTVSHLLTDGASSGPAPSRRVVTIDADAIVHELQKPNTSCIRAIQKEFPTAVNGEGVLDREVLGNIIFNDVAARRRLGSIMNRRVMWVIIVRLLQAWWRCKRDQLVVLDVPLLFETGMDKLVTATVVVSSTRELQISRQMSRNGITEAAAVLKINAQMPMEARERRAQYIIRNTGSLTELEGAVEEAMVWVHRNVSCWKLPYIVLLGGASLIAVVVAVAVAVTQTQ
jgi:dephospho-CoA kinase